MKKLTLKISVVLFVLIVSNCSKNNNAASVGGQSITLSFYNSTGAFESKQVVENVNYFYTTGLNKKQATQADSLYVYCAPEIKSYSGSMVLEVTGLSSQSDISIFGLSFNLSAGNKLVAEPLNGSIVFTASHKINAVYSTEKADGSDSFHLMSNYECLSQYSVPAVKGAEFQFASLTAFDNSTEINLQDVSNLQANETALLSVNPNMTIIASKPIAILTYAIINNQLHGKPLP